MGPSLLTLFPNLGHSLLQYRALRLPAAQENARLLGVCGEESADSEEDRVPCASWPWESALLGFGVSPWIDGDKYEIHIAGDIALSLELAFRVSGNDPSFFTVESASNSSEAAYWPVIGASAAFFAAKAAVEASTSNYTFLNVIGPDESAGVVNDSAYTNAIASKTLKWAIEAAGVVGSIPGSNWSAIASNVFLPITLLPGSETLGHPEYSGYDGENINQADVALLQYPLGWEMPSEVAHADLVFYEQRSSTPDTKQFYTGDSAYSVAWLRLGGNKTAADAQFLQGLFHIDLQKDEYCDCASGFGVWKETLDGGNLNFLTGAGGWVQNLIFGYGGLQYTKKGSLAVLFPSLPPGGVTALVLRGITLGYGSRRVRFNIRFDNSEATFSLSGVEDRNVPVSVIDGDGMVYNLPVSLPVAQQFEVMLL
jgi:trehalose/maltose hydrolase-like predicted phosphorylase